MSKYSDRDKLRQRAKRIMLGSILTSSFTDEDIQALSEELDSSFAFELSKALGVLRAPAVPRYVQAEPDAKIKVGEVEHFAAAIYDRVRQRKIGKDRVLKYMAEINLQLSRSIASMPFTTSDLIRAFVSRASSQDANRLLDRVAGGSEEDPYLRGISERG